MTQCNQDRFEFASVQGTRQIVAEFSGGTISSDAGGLLLQETEAKMNLLARFSDAGRQLREVLGRVPGDRVILVGDMELERDWCAAGRLAGYLPAVRYFGAA